MNGGLQPLAPPEFGGVINNALNHQPDGPEHTEPEGNPFPRGVLLRWSAEVTHRRPIRKSVRAMKKVWTIIIWRLIRLIRANSSFQWKYVWKMRCRRARPIISRPQSSSRGSIGLEDEVVQEWGVGEDSAAGRKEAFDFPEELDAFRIIPDFMGGQNQKHEIAPMVRQGQPNGADRQSARPRLTEISVCRAGS